MAGGFLVTLAFLVTIGAIALATMPRTVSSMRRLAHGLPGTTILLGLIGLSAVFGLVPVSAISIVGIPLVPIAILLALLAWTLGYVLGAYVLAMAAARAFGMGDAPAMWARLGVLALAVTVAALLNFVPFLGWILNMGLVFLGVGAMLAALLQARSVSVGPALDVDMRPEDRP
jgi:hypothetical protein